MVLKTLEISDYRVYYKTLSGYVKAVDGADLEIHAGQIVGLIGESGCGKSTLAQSLVMLKYPMVYKGGSVFLSGEYDLTKMTPEERRRVLLKELSIIPQYALDALPVIKKIKAFVKDLARDKGMSEREVVEVFKERIKQVNLPDRILDMYPLELSGGMRQRVVIAVSTLFKPNLLIADEPTSALDVVTQRQVLELLKKLRDDQVIRSLLFITHDVASIRQIADRIATMYAGKIVEEGPVDAMLKDPLHPYTKLLVRSIPPIGLSHREMKLRGLAGSPPSLFNPPSGCRFHPRCPHAMERCEIEEPPKIRENNHTVSCWLHVKR